MVRTRYFHAKCVINFLAIAPASGKIAGRPRLAGLDVGDSNPTNGLGLLGWHRKRGRPNKGTKEGKTKGRREAVFLFATSTCAGERMTLLGASERH